VVGAPNPTNKGIAPGRFVFEGSVFGPQGLDMMVFYMSRRLAESALLMGATVLSNDSISQWQFVPTSSPRFDFRGSVVGPQGLDIMLFYMSKRRAERAVAIGSTVLSNCSNSHRNRWPNSPLWPPGHSILEKAS
jgi:hypothetical protein